MDLNRNNAGKVLLCLAVILLTSGIYLAAAAVPNITNAFPASNAIDIEFHPTFTADIFDADGDTVDWIIREVSMETSWAIIGQGTVNGTGTISATDTSLINQYDTNYSWMITATDSTGQITEQIYTFTSRSNTNYAPFVRNPIPANNAVGVKLNPTLQAYVKDIDGDPFSWRVDLRKGKTGNNWSQIGSGPSSNGEATINIPTSTVTSYETDYSWRVRATATNGSKTTTDKTFYFTTKPENYMPSISNVYPADQSMDVPLSPTLYAEIIDLDNDPINWTVEILNGTDWSRLEVSGENALGSAIVSVPTDDISDFGKSYSTDYSWRISASDGKVTNWQEFMFTSRQESYVPTITNVTPFDGQTAIQINTTLMAFIEDKDGQNMDVNFSFYNDTLGDWSLIDHQKNTTKTFRTSNGWKIFTQPMTDYKWKISADDHTGNVVEQNYTFKTGILLVQKFRKNISNTGGDQIMPVMGDINNDGTQELVMDIGTNIVAINGKTGDPVWSVPGGSNTAVELVDINKDGIPEVLTAMDGPKLRALNGKDGSTIWIANNGHNLKGEGMALFPIIAYDIDGDGYPTIYFASEDQTPFGYSGNLSDYKGALSMIDHNGNVLNYTWIYHPCWGGMSLGDVNYDGKFELYVSDRRRQGYLDGKTSLGPHAYDAETLQLLWSRPDIQGSSPMPIIADVVPDNNQLEVVLNQITMAGPIVVDGMTNQTLTYQGRFMDYQNRELPTHGVGTVYDIDGDGNMEIILATSYPANAPPEFVVFDLITGTTEFRPVLENQVAWAPKVGDVDGDGKMEILVAEGPQGWGGTYPLLVYKYDPSNEAAVDGYVLIDRVDPKNAGQLMPARVYDTDSDGLNEVVVVGYKGILTVYDTNASTSSPGHPAPRTWLQMYSEYRQGAAEYVKPPGPPQPFIKNEYPTNNSIGVEFNPILSFNAFDLAQDRIDIEISTNASGDWEVVKSFKNVTNDRYNYTTNMTEQNTTYYWKVNIVDSYNDNIPVTKTFSFTSTSCPDGSKLIISYKDADGDGYGDNTSAQQSCGQPPSGFVLNSTDCNDANLSINPGALEICDGIDNNCDLGIDDLDTDLDTVLDCHPDNCIFVPNPDQLDTNNNSIGDACECGNGIINSGEECDGLNLNGESCSSVTSGRMTVGNLKCSAYCLIDATGCSRKKSSSPSSSSSSSSSSSAPTSDTDWTCTDWSPCVNGKQSQVCTHNTRNAQKTNTQTCKITVPVELTEQDKLLIAELDRINSQKNNTNATNGTISVEPGLGVDTGNETTNATQDSEITGAAFGFSDSNRPAWALALMVLGVIGAIALFGMKKKGIGKKPAYHTLENE